MYFSQILAYYTREDVQRKMVELARSREVAGVFKGGAFGQRPNMLQYPADITSMVRDGALEFHCSLEQWSQPMAIKSDNYGQLRVGWDFVVDIDCDDFLHGRATAVVFCKALEEHGIKGYSVKFTGGSGFHIGIPWASMPKRVDYKPTETLFPELPRAMAAYMKEYCRDQLEEALLKVAPPEKLAEQAKIDAGTLLTKDGIDPYKLVEIDAVLLSPRHLFRMPYSLNAKSFLASLPVKPAELATFVRDMANPSRFKAALGFLDSGIENEAGALVAETMDWQTKNKKSFGAKAPAREYKFSRAVEPEHFPPCIKRISEGLADGKKRALFALLNFLSSAGWKWDDIEKFVEGWNQKNSPPLPDNYIRTHIKWNSSRMQSQGRSMLPPGCTNEGWYAAIGVCFPDEICGGAVKSVKNPANYPVRKLGLLKSEPKQERPQPRRQARRPRDPWPRAARKLPAAKAAGVQGEAKA